MKNNALRLRFAGSFLIGYLASMGSVQAQIVPDQTLPVNSSVTPGCLICTINGGTVRGVNLFHSFQQFSIPTGGSAHFNNSTQIQNILTRVTGTSLSNIDGLIRANGTANLFLLNPHGIVFGPSARLQLGGSFAATTANSFKFPDGSVFSATNPQAPPLLAVNVAPGVQFGARPSGSTITNAGNLAVPAGQSITLLGATTTSTGTLRAPGGMVQVLGDRVALLDNAIIDVSSPTGGGAVLVGGDYKGQGTVPNAVQTYVAPTVTLNADATTHGNGGKVIVWADETTRFYGNISARGGSQSGNGGFVEVSGSQNLFFQGQVDTAAAFGKTGTLLLDPTDITVVEGEIPSPPKAADGIWSTTEDPGTQTIGANAIATLLNTNSLTLEATNTISVNENVAVVANSPNNLTLKAFTIDLLRRSILRQSGGGSIILDTTQNEGTAVGTTQGSSVSITGGTASGVNDLIGIDTTVPRGESHTGGDIQIITGTLTLVKGGRLNADTQGLGDAGSIKINATNAVILEGENSVLASVEIQRGGVFSEVLPGAKANGGNIEIDTKTLSVNSGARLSTSTDTENGGNAGNITIRADAVDFKGTGKAVVDPTLKILKLREEPSSGAFSLVERGAVGNSGSIDISTRTLSVTKGARLSAVTNGRGHAGNVKVTASESAFFDGVGEAPVDAISFGELISTDEKLFPPSGAFSSVRDQATVTDGVRGSVAIETPFLSVTNGARLTSSSSGRGDAGDVTIIANSVFFSGAGSNAQSPEAANSDDLPGGINILTQGVGNGGTVNITTQNLTVDDGIVIGALTRGIGNAGNVIITATNLASFDRSFIISEVQGRQENNGAIINAAVGNGGDIDITAGSLSLTNGAEFRTNTSGFGNAGNVFVRNARNVSLFNSSISTAVNSGSVGQGGTVEVQTTSLALNNNARIAASTSAQGKAGEIIVNATTFDAASGSQLLTTTFSSGQAGNITLNVRDRLSLSDPDTAVLANTTKGSSGLGGNILIDPRIVEIKNGARVAVDSAGTNQGGNIFITAGKLTLDNGSVTAETASNQGGNITINAGNLLVLRHNSLISATAGTDQAGGNGGNVTLTTPFVIGVLAENSNLRANAFRGNGGNITINANQVFGLRPQPQETPFSDITASSQLGINGNVILNTLNLDPSQGLQELNLTLVDPSSLVKQGCNSDRKVVEGQSKFVVLGRGGLSSSPDDPFGGTLVLNDLGSPTASTSTAASVSLPPQTAPTSTAPMVEAQGWVKDSNGKIYLVNQFASTPVDGTQPLPIRCQGR